MNCDRPVTASGEKKEAEPMFWSPSGRRIVALAFAALAAVGFGSSVLAGDVLSTAATARRIAEGFRIAPVPLDLQGLDRALVGLGSYIVNAQGGCNDCHTNPPYAPNGDPFDGGPVKINKKGYLAGGQEFGRVVSANLTPDAKGKPAGHSFKQFLRLIRTGRHPGDGRILQVMPWPAYRNMTDHDLRAIYEYLRAIPSRGKHEEAATP
jgi:hypothetical protein